MALTQNDKQEIREMLQDCMAGSHARTESKFEIIEVKLNHILEQTTKTNGRVTKLEEDNHDFKNHVKNTHDYDNKIRVLEDHQLSTKVIKKWVVGSVAVTGTVMSIIFIIFKLMEGV
jgi:hypothetical protein